MTKYILAALLCLAPGLALGAASQLSNSQRVTQINSDRTDAVVVHCNNTDGNDTVTGGETCEDGDWTKPIDASKFSKLTAYARSWGSGQVIFSIYSCAVAVDGQWTRSSSPPSTSSSKTANVPCQEITRNVTLDGDNLKNWSFSEDGDQTALGDIIVEISCTGTCDSRLDLSLKR